MALTNARLNQTFWYLRNKIAGVKDWEPPPWNRNLRMAHVCPLYYCPVCGDVWSRLITFSPDTRSCQLWVAHPRKCPSHGKDPLLSLLQKRQPEMLLERYPIELLRYEGFIS